MDMFSKKYSVQQQGPLSFYVINTIQLNVYKDTFVVD